MTTEPVSLAEAKRHLRVENDDPYIDDLASYITGARQHVEQYLSASIVSQTRTERYDAFPSGCLTLPNGPVTSITSIAYIDTDGVNQTVDSYLKVDDTISPAYAAAWPSTRRQIGAVTITYIAGMMTGSPPDLTDHMDVKNAILLVLADLWENREAQIIGVSTVPNATLDRLLYFHRRQLGT